MICLIAGNYKEAETWARGQMLHYDEWFFPRDEIDLMAQKNFHVVVVGTAGMNSPPAYFEKILQLAWSRGRLK